MEPNCEIFQQYYPILEATKVIQVILDQHGMYLAGRLVCKKWNSYLTSKPRDNLVKKGPTLSYYYNYGSSDDDSTYDSSYYSSSD